MPGADTGFDCGVIFGRLPHRMGNLFSPSPADKNGTPRVEYRWALDNGVFGAWQSGSEWSEEPLYRFLDRFAFLRPDWVVVPDWVSDRDQTLRLWDQHAPALAAFGCPLAFAAQNGMTPEDVPTEAEVVFVGGSTSWKWRNLRMWCEHFPRVHVGRVNTYHQLCRAHDAGCESCDGTGWFRGRPHRKSGIDGMIEYLEESEKGERKQRCLEL